MKTPLPGHGEVVVDNRQRFTVRSGPRCQIFDISEAVAKSWVTIRRWLRWFGLHIDFRLDPLGTFHDTSHKRIYPWLYRCFLCSFLSSLTVSSPMVIQILPRLSERRGWLQGRILHCLQSSFVRWATVVGVGLCSVRQDAGALRPTSCQALKLANGQCLVSFFLMMSSISGLSDWADSEGEDTLGGVLVWVSSFVHASMMISSILCFWEASSLSF